MKTRLECRADRLEAQQSCPNCGAPRRHFLKSADHFSGQLVSGDYLMGFDQKVCAAFFCGSEFSVNAADNIVCTIPCTEPSHHAALNLDQEAEDVFEDQEEAA